MIDGSSEKLFNQPQTFSFEQIKNLVKLNRPSDLDWVTYLNDLFCPGRKQLAYQRLTTISVTPHFTATSERSRIISIFRFEIYLEVMFFNDSIVFHHTSIPHTYAGQKLECLFDIQ